MSRIRSIHPGLFTDESFMSATIPARMLIIGIWTEAYDDGVFEWKPITLKARIFPVDNVDTIALLAELEGLGFIKSFSVGGKQYGIIRNFCKFQRPKKPNSSGVLPESLRSYCGYSITSPEPVPNRSVTSPEKSPQMEDGGWREGEKEDSGGGLETRATAAAAALPEIEEGRTELVRRLNEATAWKLKPRNIEQIEKLIASGVSLDDRIIPIAKTVAAELSRQGKPVPDTWAYLAKPIMEPDRLCAPASREVDLIWIRPDTPEWQAMLAAGKKESFLRGQLRKSPDGLDAMPIARSALPVHGAAA